ncbi:hypothetical protein [Micromonospora sp. 4G55]|uniref:hypothetical protein n=1 Tax=Micromonospora sp. 4G55 TaxID=2806102 RepID=UPI001A45EBF2|nr:hypothetical protein [Micromonospora sp. 4G55]MBM0256372.1 hypothetical protein [Micromonospora sp. 4G55]
MADTGHRTLADNPANDVLLIGLDAAVPLWMLELAALPAGIRDERRMRWAAEAADAVAYQGHTLQYGGKRGEAAKVFNALARGLAAGAYQPGGITFAGRHWCADHQLCVDADAHAHEPLPEPAAPSGPTLHGRPLVDVPLPPEVL